MSRPMEIASQKAVRDERRNVAVNAVTKARIFFVEPIKNKEKQYVAAF